MKRPRTLLLYFLRANHQNSKREKKKKNDGGKVSFVFLLFMCPQYYMTNSIEWHSLSFSPFTFIDSMFCVCVLCFWSKQKLANQVRLILSSLHYSNRFGRCPWLAFVLLMPCSINFPVDIFWSVVICFTFLLWFELNPDDLAIKPKNSQMFLLTRTIHSVVPGFILYTQHIAI